MAETTNEKFIFTICYATHQTGGRYHLFVKTSDGAICVMNMETGNCVEISPSKMIDIAKLCLIDDPYPLPLEN